MRQLIATAVLIAVASSAVPAAAKVTATTAAGFDIRHEASVAAAPQAVWRVLVEPRRWWNKAHSWSGSSDNLTLDPRPGGCFCEKLPDGGVEHMRVVFAAPAKMLRMTGALGPLQGEAASATMTIELKPEASGTVVTLRYVVGGYLATGAAPIASAVDGVLAEQLAGLKRAAEGERGR